VEAPANLLLLANAAVAAYTANGDLCADPPSMVPATPPAGRCYQPDDQPGIDFGSGDANAGWACLGVASALVTPIHCSYAYRIGSGYLGPALGGPDPGPTGFEVAAQGDYDDNGIYSTFTIAGTFDPTQGTFTLSPLFQHDPQE
jgi:hypothetical protein